MQENKKKKLLVTASTFPRWEGDTEPRFVLDLSRNMTDKFDVTALVPACPGAKDEEMLDGVKVIRYHYFPIHKWETLCYPGAIVPRIKEKKARIFLVPFLFISLWYHLLKILPEYDIVHAHWLIPQGIVQSFFKKPYIVTGHGGDVVSLNGGIMKWLKRRCLRNAVGVAVVSDYLKGRVEEIAPGCEPEIISMGVDTSKFGKQHYVPDYFGQGGKKVVLFVGRLAEVKGVTYLIEAMKNVDEAILVIAGDGPLRNELREQAKGQEDKIIFLGAKAHDELKRIYASADVCTVPSVTTKNGGQEGLSLAILEAFASGKPVVASDSGGISSVVHDGVNGYLCREKDSAQLAEKINAILHDDALMEAMSNEALKTAAEYDYRRLAERYAGMLENALTEA